MFRKIVCVGVVAMLGCSAQAKTEAAPSTPLPIELTKQDAQDLNCAGTFGFGLVYKGKNEEITDDQLRIAMASGFFMGKLQGRYPDSDFKKLMENLPPRPITVDDSEAASLRCIDEVKWLFPESSKIGKSYEKKLKEDK